VNHLYKTTRRLFILVIIFTFLTSSFLPNLVIAKSDDIIEATKDKNNERTLHGHTSDNKTRANKQSSVTDIDDPTHAVDELIISYKNNSNISRLRQKHGLKELKKLSSINAELVKIPAGVDLTEAISKLKKDAAILSVQPNYKYYPSATVPNDPLFKEQWGLHSQQTSNIDIDAFEAWEITKGSSDIIVAVIDTGIDINHPDLKANIWVNAAETINGKDNDNNGYTDDVVGWNFLDKNNQVFDPYHGDEHGTHVAGIIAAEMNNHIGITGVAPNVKIMPLKFIGPKYGNTASAIEAINYATKMGAHIINASWGGPDYDHALKEAIENSGLLFVAAAGNDGQNNNIAPFYPASFPSKNIVSVGAINNRGTKAAFSNYGSAVDIAAPGVNILSTVPYEQQANGQSNYEQAYGYMSGTSMAAPHVAGTAALIYSQDPTIDAEVTIALLKKTGKHLQSLKGIVNSSKLVNANQALTTKPSQLKKDIPGYPLVNNHAIGLLDDDNPNDVYSINVDKGDIFSIQLDAPLADGNDFDLYLFAPNALTIDQSNSQYIDPMAKSTNSGTVKEEITFRALVSGEYFINVRRVNGNGQYSLKVTEKILPVEGSIESPKQDALVNGTTTVTGWILSGKDIEKVEVLVDGKKVGEAKYGNIRNDIHQRFPHYYNENSGFSYQLNTTTLTNGNRSITIRAIGTNGTVTNFSRNVVVENFATQANVTAIKAVSADFDKIRVSWDQVSRAQGYEVFRATTRNGAYTRVGTVTSGSTTNFTNSGLITGTTYFYKVRAYRTVNDSRISSAYSDITSGRPLLAKVASPKVASVGFDRMKVSWSQVSGASGYEVYRATSRGGTYSKVGTVTRGTTLSFTNTGLTSGRTYFYKVRAYRLVDEKQVFGAYASIVDGKPIPARPTNVKASKVNSTATSLSWSRVTGASGYEIHRATSKNGSYSRVGTVTSGSTLKFRNNSLKRGQTYHYKVRSYRTVNGTRVYSNYSTVVVYKN
jgi:subtilisin family serine protease